MSNRTFPIRPQKTVPDSDQILWQELKNGNESAYEKLYNLYVEDLYNYGCMLANDAVMVEDAIHDVFSDIWKSRKNLSNVNSARLYLFSSVKRRLFRKIKKARVFMNLDDDPEVFLFETVPSFLDEIITEAQQESLLNNLKNCLNNLSSRQREIIYLRFYQSMSYLQIAELLNLDQKYVYNLASKAFCALRNQISDHL